mmetsp:Transcript_115010/g.245637  ORF Transcript_115010/g.245637 Transcript_115010/m.245637 type:complete len:242 (-) Transcript_115010:416-1141(-)
MHKRYIQRVLRMQGQYLLNRIGDPFAPVPEDATTNKGEVDLHTLPTLRCLDGGCCECGLVGSAEHRACKELPLLSLHRLHNAHRKRGTEDLAHAVGASPHLGVPMDANLQLQADFVCQSNLAPAVQLFVIFDLLADSRYAIAAGRDAMTTRHLPEFFLAIVQHFSHARQAIQFMPIALTMLIHEVIAKNRRSRTRYGACRALGGVGSIAGDAILRHYVGRACLQAVEQGGDLEESALVLLI